MSELVWLRNQRGQPVVQIWHGPPFCGVAEFVQKGTNENGQPLWGMFADQVLKRIPIKDGEEKLGLNELAKMYPLA